MIRYISLRLLFALPALWLIVTMVFLLAHIVPGDPVAQMLGEGARADDLQQLRHALGLDVPIPLQYERYLKGVLHGNLGESFRFQQPVVKVMLRTIPRRWNWPLWRWGLRSDRNPGGRAGCAPARRKN